MTKFEEAYETLSDLIAEKYDYNYTEAEDMYTVLLILNAEYNDLMKYSIAQSEIIDQLETTIRSVKKTLES